VKNYDRITERILAGEYSEVLKGDSDFGMVYLGGNQES